MKKYFSLIMCILFGLLCVSCQLESDPFEEMEEEVETDNEEYLAGVEEIGSLCLENLTGKDIVIVRFKIDKKSYKIEKELIYDSTLGKEVMGIKNEDSVTIRLPAKSGSVSFFFPDSGKKQTLIEKVEIPADETITVQITTESKVRVEK